MPLGGAASSVGIHIYGYRLGMGGADLTWRLDDCFPSLQAAPLVMCFNRYGLSRLRSLCEEADALVSATLFLLDSFFFLKSFDQEPAGN